MKFSILTLFPDVIEAYVSASIVGRARQKGVVEIEAINFRDFSADAHRKVDDSPFGGGSGMVLTCQPLESAYQSLLPLQQPARVLMTTPTGRRFDHRFALELSEARQVVLFCGHYEGFDERIKSLIPEMEEVSMGDYVLTGGELPALSIVDAVTRLLPGAVQKFTSVQADSFYDGLLDYPHYTRPAEYKGLQVPEVLLSGNHAAIEQWRKAQALERTQRLRPDLLQR
ncbi:tRNA (guanosine(37)-N1)-methyltransferase TrmD [Vampirovibrio chlorellavorus]|uniref:tRNA (guanosine(37)-N1)-methyltransferase TrmD n=1 Tax=Vampirovibrio chlorellavorus TaxID=758823 RepID=UPI0026F37400|nr:tRNA (guanosine(37)-N1)-methyltransferase TrmD [Vampirovibrio chlorellavorus]